jgi:probable biosynthetic protein (TIGR04099 family)
LAEQLGLPTPNFRDEAGNRLYPAFVAVRLSNARFASVNEGQELRITTVLNRISRTQFVSSHHVASHGASVATVSMASVFLRRTVGGNNRQVERAIAKSIALPPIKTTADAIYLIEAARRLRSGQWDEHLGFRQRGAVNSPATLVFRPCPQNDFNGAEFLYFASFQTIVDRAHWHWKQDSASLAPTQNREMFYYGNLDVGEHLRVVYRSAVQMCGSAGPCRLWTQIYREADGKLIADVFTLKQSEQSRC